MRQFLIPTILTVLTIVSCNNGDTGKNTTRHASPKFQKLSWLEGAWIMQAPEGSVTEMWSWEADTLLAGSSSFINKKGDTVMTESIRLVEEKDTIWYIPTVGNQNEGKPIRFKELFISDTLLSFENPFHDYPQRIIYRKLSDTSIDARIEGIENGKTSFSVFHYIKKAK